MRASWDQKHKALWLRAWAAEAGLAALSHDEAVQLVVAGALPPPLADLWARKAAEQRHVGALVAAATRGDRIALQVCAPACPAGTLPRALRRMMDARQVRGVGKACIRLLKSQGGFIASSGSAWPE